MFAVKEVNGRSIDVEACFAPTPMWRTAFIKFFLASWTVSVLVTDLLWEYEADERNYYLIYLTNWCHFMTVIYTFLSLTISMCPGLAKQPAASKEDSDVRPGFVVRFTWGLYATVTTIQMAVALLFWLLEYSFDTGCPSYNSLMKHGVFMVLVLLEGLVLNSIPIRAKHVVFPVTLACLFLIWSILQAVFNIGNPLREDDDEETDDDAIYGAINWRERPESTAQVAVVSSFVLVPILFLTLWTASKISKRRYLETNRAASATNNYTQMST